MQLTKPFSLSSVLDFNLCVVKTQYRINKVKFCLKNRVLNINN